MSKLQFCLSLCMICCLAYSGIPALAQDELPDENNLNRMGMKINWWNQADMNPRIELLEYVVVDELAVFTQSNAGTLTAFDAETGKKLWTRLMSKFGEKMYPVASNKQYVMAAVGLKLINMDRFNGNIIWEAKLTDVPSTAPVSDDKRVYLGMLDGSMLAYDIEKIEELTKQGINIQEPRLIQAWRYKTGKTINSPALIAGNSIIFGSLDHSIYSVTSQDRILNYQFETDAPISANIETNGSRIFIASEDFNFYCINAKTGQVQWTFVSGLPIRSKPIALYDKLYLLPDRGGIISINTKDGSNFWPTPVPDVVHFLSLNRNFICCMKYDGRVVMINHETGTIAGSIPPNNFVFPVQNDKTDRLILATKSGLITSIKLSDQEFPIYHRHPDQRPVIPIFDTEEAAKMPADNAAEKPADNN